MSAIKAAAKSIVGTTSTLTRDFRHLDAPTYLRGYARVKQLRNPKEGVRTHDRIKYWNIVPGDKVRIINGPLADKDAVRTVAGINKLTNQVSLRGVTAKAGQSGVKMKLVHYSNVQLLVGKYEVEAAEGSQAKTENVWATRLSSSKPFFLKKHGTWIWNRYAAATSIELPPPTDAEGKPLGPARKNRLRIPWPKTKKEDKNAGPGPTDTLPEDALAVTYVPPHPKHFTEMTGLDHLYIRSLHPEQSFFNPTVSKDLTQYLERIGDDVYASDSIPIEQFLADELSNPHSRTKKQKRWQEKEAGKLELKEKYIQEELARARRTGAGREFGGRKVKPHEAKRIAVWKWKNALLRQATREKHLRWVARGGEENKKRRHERGVRKLRRQQERLRQLTFKEEENQVIPQ